LLGFSRFHEHEMNTASHMTKVLYDGFEDRKAYREPLAAYTHSLEHSEDELSCAQDMLRMVPCNQFKPTHRLDSSMKEKDRMLHRAPIFAAYL
jgi:hypothetical protein